MKKILFFISIVGALSITSCNNDVDDIFDDDATTRVNKAVSQWNNVLTSASNGWIVEYYPEGSQAYGGYTFLMKFETDAEYRNVTIASQVADATDTETSMYDITKEDGPVLNMETYNTLFHAFRDPDDLQGVGGANKHGYEGDILFILPELTDDIRNGGEFVMYGLQTKNKIRMQRLDPDVIWSTYLSDIQTMKRNLEEANISDYYANIDGRSFRLQEDGQYFRFKYAEDTDLFYLAQDYIAYCITTQGIRLYKPLKLGSKEFQELIWDPASRTMTAINDSSVVLSAVSPDYKIEDYLGSWKLNVYNRPTQSREVWNITASKPEREYPALGWDVSVWATPGRTIPDLSNIEPIIQYTFNKQTGTLDLPGAVYVSLQYHTYNGNRGTFSYYPYSTDGTYIYFENRPTMGIPSGNTVTWYPQSSNWELEGYCMLFRPNNTSINASLIMEMYEGGTWTR